MKQFIPIFVLFLFLFTSVNSKLSDTCIDKQDPADDSVNIYTGCTMEDFNIADEFGDGAEDNAVKSCTIQHESYGDKCLSPGQAYGKDKDATDEDCNKHHGSKTNCENQVANAATSATAKCVFHDWSHTPVCGRDFPWADACYERGQDEKDRVDCTALGAAATDGSRGCTADAAATGDCSAVDCSAVDGACTGLNNDAAETGDCCKDATEAELTAACTAFNDAEICKASGWKISLWVVGVLFLLLVILYCAGTFRKGGSICSPCEGLCKTNSGSYGEGARGGAQYRGSRQNRQF